MIFIFIILIIKLLTLFNFFLLLGTFTNVIPSQHIGKSLGIFSTITSLINVVAPIYGVSIVSYYGGTLVRSKLETIHFLLFLIIFIIFKFSNKNNKENEILNQTIKLKNEDEIIYKDESSKEKNS